MKIDISVVMVVYNSAHTVKDTIESIIKQTIDNFELIIVDDGSTDETIQIIKTLKDKRISIISSKHDYINSLNLGLSRSVGKYIARMDADDYMDPDRLRIQYHFMESHPDIDICSSWMQTFGDSYMIKHHIQGLIEKPIFRLLYNNFIYHPTVFIKRDFIQRNRLLYQNYPLNEDYKLWVECAKKGAKFYVLPYPLIFYRLSAQQMSQKNREKQLMINGKIQDEIVDYLIGEEYRKPVIDYMKAVKSMYDEGLIDRQNIADYFNQLKIS